VRRDVVVDAVLQGDSVAVVVIGVGRRVRVAAVTVARRRRLLATLAGQAVRGRGVRDVRQRAVLADHVPDDGEVGEGAEVREREAERDDERRETAEARTRDAGASGERRAAARTHRGDD
jgi:hypothetical protein